MVTARILLVEDDLVTIEIIREALKEAAFPHVLEVLTEGDRVIDLLLTVPHLPHLVLLDLNLPKKTGLEILREIKSDTRFSAIPVLILTNSKSEDDIAAAYENHCNSYVRKPMGFDATTTLMLEISKFWFGVATIPGMQ